MVNYSKPLVLANEELAEGVYAASGATGGGEGCYTVTVRNVQKPALGNEVYTFQMDSMHDTETHHSTAQTLYVTFSEPVYFESCLGDGAKYVSGTGTSTLVISYTYHKNKYENIGLGDLKVKAVSGSWDGLTVVEAHMECNYDCSQHSHEPSYPG